jgi:murein DD-endopeptidase MepM/ murein hydrolase activator NlpD
VPIAGGVTRRILATGLACAALFAAVLGAPAPADDPAASPTATATASAPPDPTPASSPAETPTDTPTQAPTQAPTQTATATPTQSATATPTSSATDTPTPYASPVKTTVAPAVTAAPTAAARPHVTRHARVKRHRAANVAVGGTGAVKVCSTNALKHLTSTSRRECVKQPPVTSTTPAPEPVAPAPRLTQPDGSPAPTNPSYSLSTPGPAKVGVPNFFIDKFRIPPFLLPIYQAAGMQYGIRWQVLAGINEIETDYGRNLNVSSAGAVGWMQFMPATWAKYGVDANQDGVKDPFNPVDAIFAAARYLKAAGGDHDIRRAIFAYNHANWYVDSVLMRAQVVAGMPDDLVGSLTGLTQGRFPVRARATYADALTKADRRVQGTNAAVVVQSQARRKSIDIFSRRGAPVIAVNDSKVVKLGRNRWLGRYVVLQDVYGNTYTYGDLGQVAKTYPAPKPRRAHGRRAKTPDAAPAAIPATAAVKQRLFAHPQRPGALAAGGSAQLAGTSVPGRAGAPLGLDPRDFVAKPLRKGAQVLGGTVIGHIGKTDKRAPHLLFEIRPAGRGAPRIDPKPILDGWKLLESTAIYRAKGKIAMLSSNAAQPSVGQIMLMSKEALGRRVLADPRIQIYPCGQDDIRSGVIDRRVLAALKCGHSYLTTSGNVSEHSTGTAVDIAAINGIPIAGHQGPGSITDVTIQRLLTLQGSMKPHQIISLMTFKGADNTLALPDHWNHIHVGWRPMYGENRQASRQINQILRPSQWIKLISRLGQIDNPTVSAKPSKYSIKVARRSRAAGNGD